VGPRAGLDDVEKGKFLTLARLEPRTVGRPARSECMRVHSQKRCTSRIARRLDINLYACKIFQISLNRFRSLQHTSIT
jgi:hypothetical protein